MTVGRPELRVEGEDLLFSYPSDGVEIVMNNLTEDRKNGTHATVLVSVDDVKISWGQLKIDSSDMRARLAKSLTTKYSGLEWEAMLAQSAFMALEKLQERPPLLMLDEVPVSGPPRFLLDPMLPENETVLFYGDSESGKSALCLYLAMGIAAGIQMPYVIGKAQGAVLYLDWETNPETHSRRLRRLKEGAELPNKPLPIFYQQMHRPLSSEISFVRRLVSEHRVKLVVIDSLASALGDDLNDGAVAAKNMTAFRSLGITRLVIHHISHSSAASTNGNGSGPYGSRFFRHLSRSVWEVRRAEQEDPNVADLGLFHMKVNEGPKRGPFGYRLKYGDSLATPISVQPVSIEGHPQLSSFIPPGKRIAAELKGGSKTMGELIDALGMERDQLRYLLQQDGRFMKLADGRGKQGGSVWGLKAVR